MKQILYSRFKVYWLIAFLLIGILPDNSQAMGILHAAKITVRVIDESGKPVQAARVGIGFGENSKRHEIPVDGISGEDGRFSASESCNGHLGFNVKKDGYYMSIGSYDFNDFRIRWKPWNPEVTVVLRKIENPVPMYARDTSRSSSPFEIPVAGKDVGFDLMLFDWLPPYGKGLAADFFCNLAIRDGGDNDFDCSVNITFPQELDGIQSVEEELLTGSSFKLPRLAPENGYMKSIKVFIKRSPSGGVKRSKKDNRSYIFRVRSEVEKGKLKKAQYGKIIGDISLGFNKKGTVDLYFKYYLNPDYTRNLEFDPDRNLFLDLPDYEKSRFN